MRWQFGTSMYEACYLITSYETDKTSLARDSSPFRKMRNSQLTERSRQQRKNQQ